MTLSPTLADSSLDALPSLAIPYSTEGLATYYFLLFVFAGVAVTLGTRPNKRALTRQLRWKISGMSAFLGFLIAGFEGCNLCCSPWFEISDKAEKRALISLIEGGVSIDEALQLVSEKDLAARIPQQTAEKTATRTADSKRSKYKELRWLVGYLFQFGSLFILGSFSIAWILLLLYSARCEPEDKNEGAAA